MLTWESDLFYSCKIQQQSIGSKLRGHRHRDSCVGAAAFGIGRIRTCTGDLRASLTSLVKARSLSLLWAAGLGTLSPTGMPAFHPPCLHLCYSTDRNKAHRSIRISLDKGASWECSASKFCCPSALSWLLGFQGAGRRGARCLPQEAELHGVTYRKLSLRLEEPFWNISSCPPPDSQIINNLLCFGKGQNSK